MMRRNRMRSYTIDAENEEEFIKEYDKLEKDRLQKNNNKNLEEDDEEDGLGGLGAKMEISEEDELGLQDYDDDELAKDYEDNANEDELNKEKLINILINFLKNSIISHSNNFNSNEMIFIKNNNISKSQSGNAIHDLDMQELVNNLMEENDNEYTKSSEGNNNSLKDYIFQNIESDYTLKIMFLSNNKSTKYSLMSKFFGIEVEKGEKDYMDDLNNISFQIMKKKIKLFNKKITLQIYDTSDSFHKNSISSAYYRSISSFFIFIEAYNHGVIDYLNFIFEKLNIYISNRTVVIFGINMLFEEDCTIEKVNLRDYAKEKKVLYIPLKVNDFNLKNKNVLNILNLILIKGIDTKLSVNSNRKGSKDMYLKGFRNTLTKRINDSNSKKNLYDITKMKINNCLGYKKRFRLQHINAFDLYDKDNKFRKLSI